MIESIGGEVDVDTSSRVVRSMWPPPADLLCYLNAYRALRAAENNDQLLYVEGWAGRSPPNSEPSGITVLAVSDPVWHAWLEDANGRVIEVTPGWLWMARSGAPFNYWPVHRHSLHELERRLQRSRVLPLHAPES